MFNFDLLSAWSEYDIMMCAEPCEKMLGPPKKIQMGPFNISKHLGRCNPAKLRGEGYNFINNWTCSDVITTLQKLL